MGTCADSIRWAAARAKQVQTGPWKQCDSIPPSPSPMVHLYLPHRQEGWQITKPADFCLPNLPLAQAKTVQTGFQIFIMLLIIFESHKSKFKLTHLITGLFTQWVHSDPTFGSYSEVKKAFRLEEFSVLEIKAICVWNILERKCKGQNWKN